jgi:hypothetical protein
MSRTGWPVTDAAGDVAAAAVAVVSVSAAVARLLTDRALHASQIAISRRQHVPVVRPSLARALRRAADDVRAAGARRLGDLAVALLPRTAAAVAALVGQYIDIVRIAARLDLDPVIERAYIVELARYVVQEIELAAIIRSSTASLSTEVVRGVRGQGADADRAVERVVDRLLLRRHGRHDALPAHGT